MTKIKYWFLMLWHLYIVCDAWWILLDSNHWELGTILTATYGQQIEIIWIKGDKTLVIEWKQ